MTDAFQIPAGLAGPLLDTPLTRIEEVYLPLGSPGPDQSRGANADPDHPRRLAAVTSLYHQAMVEKRPLVLGWWRPRQSGPVTVVGSGRPASSTSVSALSFPPASRGRTLLPAEIAADLRGLNHWTRLGGVVDGLLLGDGTARDTLSAKPSLEDGLLGVWHLPFAWLLIADPVPMDEVRTLASRVAGDERDARARASSPEHQLRADRLAVQHRELRLGESAGLWRVRVLAGGRDAAESAAVAGLLCAAADLSGLPYAVAPVPGCGTFAEMVAAPATEFDYSSSFLGGSGLVAALARPPQVEIPGIRHIPRSTFDVTPEQSFGGAQGDLALGEVLDRDGLPAGPLSVPLSSVNRHTFVCGATGGGKSQTIRHLLEQATANGLPWLVIEPAKAEYRSMAARLPGAEVVVLRPGDVDAPPVGLNPLEPAQGFPLQTHVDLVKALFSAAFQADEPFPQVLATALTRCYQDLGWDLTLDRPVTPGLQPRYPTLADLQSTAQRVVAEIGYGKEIADNVKGFIDVRLSSLRLGTTGRFFEGGHNLDMEKLLRHNVVLEIEDVGDDRDKAFVMGAVLIRLTEHLRARERHHRHDGTLLHLTVVEEAHRLLRRSDHGGGTAAHAVELFAALLAEIRAYGEGLVIAEQIPSKLIDDVIKNTAVKIVHRLPSRDDRDAVGATMNLSDEQSRFLVTLPPGTGAVFTDGMDQPILVRVPGGSDREAGPGRLAGAALLIDDRSTRHRGCGPEPCTLSTMSSANRLLAELPALSLWTELATVAHLIGYPVPEATPLLRGELDGIDPAVLRCAISQGAGAGADSRSGALARSHSPALLAEHVTAELHAALVGGPACTADPHDWLAPAFRFNSIRRELMRLDGVDPTAGRHPRSDEWARHLGTEVAGDTCRDQLELVRRWSLRLLRDREVCEAVLFGDRPRSALETAVGALRTDDGWERGLHLASRRLSVFGRWHIAFLRTGGRNIDGRP